MSRAAHHRHRIKKRLSAPILLVPKSSVTRRKGNDVQYDDWSLCQTLAKREERK